MKTTSSPFVFTGGIHPDYHKELSASAPITAIAMPRVLAVPMAQHLGAPAKPVVKLGDIVKKNQLIGEPGGFISAAIHAPVAGKVTSIGEAITPSGRTCAAVVIETDEQGEAECLAPITDWQRADKAALQNRIGEAGVVGMGGAGFPTKVKLSPPANKPIDTLILNGAECEPYLTSDHRMMIEHAKEIRIGAEIIRSILGAKTVRVAIEDNKPEAIAAMEKAFADIEGDVEIFVLETSYPQGAEKQQIYSVTGREVPRGGLPMDIGCVVENVSTAYALFDAVLNGQPLTRRVASVTGDAVTTPSNLLVPNGTSYADLVAACGGLKSKAVKIISGGPMMGFSVNTLNMPTGKTTSGVVLLSAASALVSSYTSQACISCGRCVEACPMRLIPSEVSQFIEADDIESAAQVHTLDCIECGACSYVCPAHRPLTHHCRRAKAVILAKRAADAAKQQ